MSGKRGVPERVVRFGTRGSALALAQTQLAIDRLREKRPDIEVAVEIVRTEGDINRASPLTEIGGRGVFTKAIERAILNGQVDAAVHSAKDLPPTLDAAAPIVAFPDREDPRDVLVSRHGVLLEELPANPVIGTSSRRREVQIARLRPDARIVSIRGNIDTRLKKAESGEFDAIVLAAAGILRMGWGARISQFFPVEQVVPSPGQGAIAVQAQRESEVAELLRAIDGPRVSEPVLLERAFLAAIGAGCSMPVGAFVQWRDGGFTLTAMMADAAGERIVYANEALVPGDEMANVAKISTRMLRDVSAETTARFWNGIAAGAGDLTGGRVVITRPRAQAGTLLDAFAIRGAEAIAMPTIFIAPVDDTSALDAALDAAAKGAFGWLVFTSANAVAMVADRLSTLGSNTKALASLQIAAVGPATAAAAHDLGLEPSLVPEIADAEHLATALLSRLEPGARVLYPRSVQGRETIPDALRASGVEIVVVETYQTVFAPEANLETLQRVRAGDIDAMTFSSPSSVYGLIALLGDNLGSALSVAAVCAGQVTAEAAREAGFLLVIVSDDPSATALADAWAAHWSDRAGVRIRRGEQMMPSDMAAIGNFA